VKLTLLMRPDCHLCLVAERALESLGVEYEQVNVDTDAGLKERYGEAIPVVLLGEREIARAPMSVDSLRAALRGVNLKYSC
jgi:glutaredoxin